MSSSDTAPLIPKKVPLQEQINKLEKRVIWTFVVFALALCGALATWLSAWGVDGRERALLGHALSLGLAIGVVSVGADADVTVFDPDSEWVFTREATASKSTNNPFYGWPPKGKATATIVGGKVVWSEQAELVAV